MLYLELKNKQLNVELVRAVAKEIVYSDIKSGPSLGSPQLEALSQQIARETIVASQVDYLITDEPIIISSYYNENPEVLKLAREARAAFKGEESHYFIDNSDSFDQSERSDYQDRAREIQVSMQNFLAQEGIKFEILKGNPMEKISLILILENL